MVSLKSNGHQVLSVGSADKYALKLKAEGFSHSVVPFNQAGTNLFVEFRTVLILKKILSEASADVVLSWTPKGNIYAALATTGTEIHIIANVSGLGRAFVHRTWITFVVRRLLRAALSRASIVFFQNLDDYHQFAAEHIVDERKSHLLPGSGVDLNRFTPAPVLRKGVNDGLCILMIGRLLWSKGVREFVDAARILLIENSSWRFQILGAPDESDNSGVPPQLLDSWVSEGVIEYLGETEDVRPFIASSDCVVLPSYREGLPRSMLEAAAMSRPILTTDVPGCRDCVEDRITGFLFLPKDVISLVEALNRFKNLDTASRFAMGAAGRRKMELQFDERLVISRYVAAIESLPKNAGI